LANINKISEKLFT